MFAPEGYVRWIDLVDEVYDWSHRILLAYELELTGEDPNFAFVESTDAADVRLGSAYKNISSLYSDQNKASDKEKRVLEFQKVTREIQFTASLVTYLHLSEILLQFDTLLSSPTGLTMRAPDQMLLHGDRLDWCPLNNPIRSTSEFTTLFRLFDEYKFSGLDLGNRYCFIEPSTGIITLKNNSLSMLAEASSVNLSPEEIEEFYIRCVKPFLGFSIVWNSKNFPLDLSELLGSISAFEPHWNVSETHNSKMDSKLTTGKRGRKPTGAREEYFRRYPDNKPSGVSFDAISAELSDAGFPISARQVQNYERSRSK